MYPLEKRWKKHIHNAFVEKRLSYFYTALRKYGPNNFKLSLIETVRRAEDLNQREIYTPNPKINAQSKRVYFIHDSLRG